MCGLRRSPRARWRRILLALACIGAAGWIALAEGTTPSRLPTSTTSGRSTGRGEDGHGAIHRLEAEAAESSRLRDGCGRGHYKDDAGVVFGDVVRRAASRRVGTDAAEPGRGGRLTLRYYNADTVPAARPSSPTQKICDEFKIPQP